MGTREGTMLIIFTLGYLLGGISALLLIAFTRASRRGHSDTESSV